MCWGFEMPTPARHWHCVTAQGNKTSFKTRVTHPLGTLGGLYKALHFSCQIAFSFPFFPHL